MSALEGTKDLFARAVASPTTATHKKTDVMVVKSGQARLMVFGYKHTTLTISPDTEMSFFYCAVLECFLQRELKPTFSEATPCVVGKQVRLGDTMIEVLGIGPAEKLYEDKVIAQVDAAKVMTKTTKLLALAERKHARMQKEIEMVKDKAAKEIAAVQVRALNLDKKNHEKITILTKQRDDLKTLLQWEIKQGETFVSSSQQLELLLPPLGSDSVPPTVSDFDNVD